MTVLPDIPPIAIQRTTVRPNAEIIVRWIAASVLLTAAGLKAYQVATEPMHGVGLLASRPFVIALVEFQAMLGVLLISGLGVMFSRRISLITFTVFLCFAGYQAWFGKSSCGCFGKIDIDPRITFAIDAALVLGLVRTMPLTSFGSANVTRRLIAVNIGILASIAAVPTMLGFRPLALVHARDLLPDTDVHDFETIEPSKAVQLVHAFRIENRGTQPVKILKATSTCSCTVAEPAKEPIPPGGYTIVHVTARWPGRFGRQREQVLLTTDSPTQASLTLTVTADIVASVVHWPKVVDFGTVIQGQTARRTIVIAAGPTKKVFAILSASVEDPLITLTAEPVAPGGEHRWIAEVTARTPAQKVRAESRFRLDRPNEDPIQVPIVYSVLPAIRAVPESVILYSTRTSESRSLKILSMVEVDKIAIISSEMDSSDFEVKIAPGSKVADGWEYLATLRLLKGNVDHISKANVLISGVPFTGQVPIVIMP